MSLSLAINDLLPDELLTDIFVQYIEIALPLSKCLDASHPSPIRVRTAQNIVLAVCVRWRRIALGTPRYWTRIGIFSTPKPREFANTQGFLDTVDEALSDLQTSIALAGSLDLYIVNQLPPNSINYGPNMSTLWRVFASVVPRAICLNIALGSVDPSFFGKLVQDASLDRMRFMAFRHVTLQGLLDILPIVPYLELLRIGNIPYSWATPTVASHEQLHTLYIAANSEETKLFACLTLPSLRLLRCSIIALSVTSPQTTSGYTAHSQYFLRFLQRSNCMLESLILDEAKGLPHPSSDDIVHILRSQTALRELALVNMGDKVREFPTAMPAAVTSVLGECKGKGALSVVLPLLKRLVISANIARLPDIQRVLEVRSGAEGVTALEAVAVFVTGDAESGKSVCESVFLPLAARWQTAGREMKVVLRTKRNGRRSVHWDGINGNALTTEDIVYNHTRLKSWPGLA